MQFNYFDIGVLLLLIAFALRGGLRGFIAEVAGLLGLAAGLALAWAFFHQFSQTLAQYIDPSAAPAVSFILLVVAGMLGVGVLARLLRKVLHFGFASGLDRLFGVFAGAAKGFLLCTLIGYGAALIAPHVNVIQTSRAMPFLRDAARWIINALNIATPMP